MREGERRLKKGMQRWDHWDVRAKLMELVENIRGKRSWHCCSGWGPGYSARSALQ